MDFDAIVVGGGHAGIEAALALARMGFATLMVTQNLDTIGKMSCNPAIGGVAKGNLVREIDALGGQMAKLIDATMIQYRVLNRSRGPAVQAPRAQADKAAYSLLAKRTLESEGNLRAFQDTVVDVVVDDAQKRVLGVRTERGRVFRSRAVVLTTGTFMEAKIFIGEYVAPSGRLGEPAATGLGVSLRRRGFRLGRLKTGTPARALRASLDLGKMEEQGGEEEMVPFSFAGGPAGRPSVPCYITYTNTHTHRVIRDNIHRSPLFLGKIEGVGPRYCPSIEDKVVRFPERERHQIFVEPEGLSTEEMYLNGISSSLPEEVQEEFLRTVPGFEHIEVTRPGYAVEYDYLDPTQLLPSLQTKRFDGLFFAGQTNGTSGYEEAAGQGIVAGINAGLFLQGRAPLILTRSEAYLGVMIDDLVTLGTKEPYRLFTSRAEYLLSLRHDTADIRLLEKGHEVGLQSCDALDALKRKTRLLVEIRDTLRHRHVQELDSVTLSEIRSYQGKSFEEVLRNPSWHVGALASLERELSEKPTHLLVQSELDVKYEGYIRRQEQQVRRFLGMEAENIPADFDYESVSGISKESREKLKQIRPVSLGQASRISGVRSADIAVLLTYLRKRQR